MHTNFTTETNKYFFFVFRKLQCEDYRKISIIFFRFWLKMIRARLQLAVKTDFEKSQIKLAHSVASNRRFNWS